MVNSIWRVFQNYFTIALRLWSGREKYYTKYRGMHGKCDCRFKRNLITHKHCLVEKGGGPATHLTKKIRKLGFSAESLVELIPRFAQTYLGLATWLLFSEHPVQMMPHSHTKYFSSRHFVHFVSHLNELKIYKFANANIRILCLFVDVINNIVVVRCHRCGCCRGC